MFSVLPVVSVPLLEELGVLDLLSLGVSSHWTEVELRRPLAAITSMVAVPALVHFAI